MGNELKRWQERINTQTEAKPTMAERNTPYFIAQYILHEAGELVESIENDEEAFGVGSEIADVMYLTLYLCEQLGFEASDLLEMKTLRNELKYRPETFNNGTPYSEAVNRSKADWESQGGDKQFSHAYIEVVDE